MTLAVTGAVLAGGDSSAAAIAGGVGGILLLAVAVAFWRWPVAGATAIAAVAGVAGRVAHRDPRRAAESVRRFAAELVAIRPRRQDWAVGLGFAALNWAADLLCLVAACRAVHAGHLGAVVLTGAYVAGMTASSVSFVPGGFGVIDVAMILALTAGGMSTADATAGVVLYRLISCVLLVAAGWIVWVSRHGGGPRAVPGAYFGQRAWAASGTPATRFAPNSASCMMNPGTIDMNSAAIASGGVSVGSVPAS